MALVIRNNIRIEDLLRQGQQLQKIPNVLFRHALILENVHSVEHGNA
jgi:hypothetical protein